jgi:DNA-binding transcriptional regulator YhcF (GntR family)
MDLVEQHGQMICGIIIDRKLKPRDMIPSLHQAAKKAGG